MLFRSQGGDRGERGERQDRGQDQRPQAGPPVALRTENADVAQIMRDIKSVLDPKWLLNQNKMFPTGAGAMESFLLALPTLEGLTPG